MRNKQSSAVTKWARLLSILICYSTNLFLIRKKNKIENTLILTDSTSHERTDQRPPDRSFIHLKTVNCFCLVIFFLFLSIFAHAETEPNNTPATSNELVSPVSGAADTKSPTDIRVIHAELDDNTLPSKIISVDTGTLHKPVSFDAAGESFNFMDDSPEFTNVEIRNFTSNDQIFIKNADISDYSFSNEGSDVRISLNYNDSGILNIINLIGMLSAPSLVYNLSSFEAAIGFTAIFNNQSTACSFSISSDSGNFAADIGTTTVSILASDSSCAWTTSENLDWVELSPTSGTGSGKVNVSVTANTVAARSVSITIAGQTYTVTQGVLPKKIELTSPSGTINKISNAFTWKSDPDATWYRLFIQEKTNKDNKLSQWYEIEDNSNNFPEVTCLEGNCSVILDKTPENGTYTWWVMGWNENGNGEWSDGMEFTLQKDISPPAKIVLNSPSGQLDETNTFSWKSDSNATWYKLFIQNSTKSYKYTQWYEIEDNFNNFPEAACVGDNCTVSLSETLDEDLYTWWVRGWNEQGNGPWSDGMNFTVEDAMFLTDDAPSYTVTTGSDVRIYGSEASNEITLESGAQAELISFPGQNAIVMQSSSDLFTVVLSDTIVHFQGSDGTALKIPATQYVQTIAFSDRTLTLGIHNNQVMLDDQVISATPAPIEIWQEII